MQVDRRAGRDRRAATRYRVSVEVEWENSWGRKTGTLGDISDLGCFVMCSGEVEDATAVKIYLPLSNGTKYQFPAEVANHLLEVGFGARFVNLTPAQQDFIMSFVDAHKDD
jgi:hypothetical protein